MAIAIGRREFITLLGGAVWPLVAQAQQDDLGRAFQMRILRLQVEAVADKITDFIIGIESQVSWTTQFPWSAATIDQRRFDGLRLLRQVAAITTLSQLDPAGMEQVKVSRLTTDVAASKTDYSQDPKFTEAVAKKVYYGPVYFPGPQRCEAGPGDVWEREALSGLGIGITLADGQVKVVFPMENAPAVKGGILAGDIIVAVDDEPVEGFTLNQVVEKLRGPANTKIKLTVMRGGRDSPIEFVITREVIRDSSRLNRCAPIRQAAPFPVTPYMTLSLAGARRDAGVSVAEVNLALVQDLVAKIHVGNHGVAYVVDSQGRVIAHRNRDVVGTNLSSHSLVLAARAPGATSTGSVYNINGGDVLGAYAAIAKLGWLVLVELPTGG